MAKIKITADQYLGQQELNRLKLFLDDEGFRKIFKYLFKSFGVSLYEDSSLEVVSGSSGFITVSRGAAIDEDLNLIEVPIEQTNVFSVPNDGNFHWVTLRYKERINEIGTVEIGTDGALIGTGTEFTKVLRGLPSNPVQIRFPESAVNTGDYMLLEVISDTNANLNVSGGSLVAEIEQPYLVVGSFTPSQTIDESQKKIFSYDDFELFLRIGTPLAGDISLARVFNNGATIEIVDVRNDNKLTLI